MRIFSNRLMINPFGIVRPTFVGPNGPGQVPNFQVMLTRNPITKSNCMYLLHLYVHEMVIVLILLYNNLVNQTRHISLFEPTKRTPFSFLNIHVIVIVLYEVIQLIKLQKICIPNSTIVPKVDEAIFVSLSSSL